MDDIRIDGYIGDDWSASGANTGQGLRALLKEREGEVTIWINSPGGQVIEASQMYTAIREYPEHVRICVDGLAASAASIVAMAGDELCMAPTAYLMVHRASSVAIGNVDGMEEAARMLRSIDEGLVDTYQQKTGMSRTKILRLMEEESWINASAAKEMGLCDRVLYQEEEGSPAKRIEEAAAAYMQKMPAACVMASISLPEKGLLTQPDLPKASREQAELKEALPQPDQEWRSQAKARLSLYDALHDTMEEELTWN